MLLLKRSQQVGQDILALSPAAWYRYGLGITVTGSGVSQWDDQSGNARHLTQGTDTNRPAKNADGSILFDGVDNFLKATAFTLNQPETLYLLVKQVSWTDGEVMCDGDAAFSGFIQQSGASPNIRIGTTGVNVTSAAAGPAVGSYGVIAAVFNGASSLFQVNDGATTTGDAGAGNMGGFTLGANATPGGYANIEVKEVILYSVAHDADTRARVISYLRRVGGI